MNDTRQLLCYSELCGQEKAKRIIEKAVESGRLAHAYIFKGPDGVGRRLFGRGVAAALNCLSGAGLRACGRCSSCKKFLSGNHPDFVVVRPEKGSIKINQIREMCRSLAYPPYESRLRVVLLEDVHTMRQEAANSLLKTLEEPPADNLLLLTAEASHNVLSTISSRCQVLPFYGLKEEECVQVLQGVLPELEAETAVTLSRLAEGSPGRALLFNEFGMTRMLARVTSVLADPTLDPDRDVGQFLQVAEEMAGLKENLVPFLGLLRLWLKDQLLRLHQPGSTPDAVIPAPGKPLKSWSSGSLFAKLQAIDKAEKELARNCNRPLVCEVLLFQLY